MFLAGLAGAAIGQWATAPALEGPATQAECPPQVFVPGPVRTVIQTAPAPLVATPTPLQIDHTDVLALDAAHDVVDRAIASGAMDADLWLALTDEAQDLPPEELQAVLARLAHSANEGQIPMFEPFNPHSSR